MTDPLSPDDPDSAEVTPPAAESAIEAPLAGPGGHASSTPHAARLGAAAGTAGSSPGAGFGSKLRALRRWFVELATRGRQGLVESVRLATTRKFWLTQYLEARTWLENTDPDFAGAYTLAVALVVLLFVRSPYSNFIFDEQEALLANPFVNGGELGWLDVVRRDFWGLPSTRSIGSYRPLPNLVWRALWMVRRDPWPPHAVNLALHAANAVLVSKFTLMVTGKRRDAWITGTLFAVSAVLTEAIAGVVGIADILGGLGVLLALVSLGRSMWLMPLLVFASVVFGLASKESSITAVGLIPIAALLIAPATHPKRPLRLLRATLALAGAAGALVAYTYFRRHFFPVTLPKEALEPLGGDASLPARVLHDFMAWFQQPRLPADPINNPLVNADTPHRIAGALRVYARGLLQVVFPWQLSADYSFPQEPVPDRLVFPGSVAGALGFVLPPLAAFALWIVALVRERRGTPSAPVLALVALGLVWVPLAYFPHSNIPMVLPTVRAERFWYLPVIGSAWVLGLLAPRAVEALPRGTWRRVGASVAIALLAFQCVRARMHSVHYKNDLIFWRATARAVPNSAKAHLNYGVMLGARGNLPGRLAENSEAKRLAPQWPMAHIYHGDTLCRLDRVEESWEHYARGFELAPNDKNLISLSLQCLWDKKAVEEHKDELLDLSKKHPGSWLAWLARDIVYHGKEHEGVQKQHRPRGYDEGPKK